MISERCLGCKLVVFFLMLFPLVSLSHPVIVCSFVPLFALHYTDCTALISLVGCRVRSYCHPLLSVFGDVQFLYGSRVVVVWLLESILVMMFGSSFAEDGYPSVLVAQLFSYTSYGA